MNDKREQQKLKAVSNFGGTAIELLHHSYDVPVTAVKIFG